MNKSSKIYITGHRGMLGCITLNLFKEIGYSYTNIIAATKFAFLLLSKMRKLLAHYIQKFIAIEIRPMILGNMKSQLFYKNYVAETYNIPRGNMINTSSFYCCNYPDLLEEDLIVFEKLLSK